MSTYDRRIVGAGGHVGVSEMRVSKDEYGIYAMTVYSSETVSCLRIVVELVGSFSVNVVVKAQNHRRNVGRPSSCNASQFHLF